MCKFQLLLLSIELIFFPEVSPPKCRLVAKFGSESLSIWLQMFCMIYICIFFIIKIDFNRYLTSNHSWNTIFCLPSNPQYGSPLVSKNLTRFSQPYMCTDDFLYPCSTEWYMKKYHIHVHQKRWFLQECLMFSDEASSRNHWTHMGNKHVFILPLGPNCVNWPKIKEQSIPPLITRTTLCCYMCTWLDLLSARYLVTL